MGSKDPMERKVSNEIRAGEFLEMIGKNTMCETPVMKSFHYAQHVNS